jgi:hypothetical protein
VKRPKLLENCDAPLYPENFPNVNPAVHSPLGLLRELGLVHQVRARQGREVLGDVHEAHS